jgi:hypothetical protein
MGSGVPELAHVGLRQSGQLPVFRTTNNDESAPTERAATIRAASVS